MHYTSATVLSASDAATATGSSIPSDQLVSASFQSIFTDTTAAGTVQIQASNDLVNDLPGSSPPTNWTNIPSATATVTAGVAPYIFLPSLAYRHMRVLYTSTTPGTGTFIVNIFALYP